MSSPLRAEMSGLSAAARLRYQLSRCRRCRSRWRPRQAHPPPRGRQSVETKPFETSLTQRSHTSGAMRTVVQVLLRELIAPVAETKVLDRPRKLGSSGGKRQELRDNLELLASLPVDIGPTRLGLDYDLATRGRCPHAVLLADSHPPPCYQRR